jgi:DNA topoisomerase-1
MPTRTIAGDCNVYFDGGRSRHQRGRVLVVVKPDDTVLVHDAEGYQPVAWLTRPNELTFAREPPWLAAIDGDESLRVEPAGEVTVAEHDVSAAGTPVGDCRCGGSLVRAGGEVVCLACEDRYPLPSGATTTDDSCECGLPRIRVDRGETFELCLDYECESLLEAVRAAFGGEWDCPCGGSLEIIRRGGLLAGCEHYPDCETAFSIPDGTVVGDCECGLPAFETAGGRRCLDTGCEAG